MSWKDIFFSYPLIDCVVLTRMNRLLEVEHPSGRAGVDAVVIEHTIYCNVLPWSCHHCVRDVAHSCTHRRKKTWWDVIQRKCFVTTSISLLLTAFILFIESLFFSNGQKDKRKGTKKQRPPVEQTSESFSFIHNLNFIKEKSFVQGQSTFFFVVVVVV